MFVRLISSKPKSKVNHSFVSRSLINSPDLFFKSLLGAKYCSAIPNPSKKLYPFYRYRYIHSFSQIKMSIDSQEKAWSTFPQPEWPIKFPNGKFEVGAVCNFDDNYSYIILDKSTKSAAFVDPAEPEKVLSVLNNQFKDYTLKAVLTTHKHGDHSGGNKYLSKLYPSIPIYGGINDDIPAVTNTVSHNSIITFGSLTIKVFESACHTRGHVLYLVDDQALFSGDTLFAAGCGRFFEGDAHEMHVNLNQTIKNLPSNVKVFCGHEYTLGNLEFAKFIEPKNSHIQQKYLWSLSRRNDNLPTIPTTIGEEKEINVFMRVDEPGIKSNPEIVKALKSSTNGLTGPVAIMQILRDLKNENAHKQTAASL